MFFKKAGKCGLDMIRLEDVSKIYSGGFGIHKVNMHIPASSIISIIGPNGVGKTTLLNVIAGVNAQTEGRILCEGKELDIIGRRKLFGYMPDEYSVSNKMTAWELLKLISDYRYQGKNYDYLINMMEIFSLKKYARTKVTELSLGNKRKLSMIIAFMGETKVVILDEPTTGVDTAGVIQLKEEILKAKEAGRTVILSSHILDFLQSISDFSYFLKGGSVIKRVKKGNDLEKNYRELYLEEKANE